MTERADLGELIARLEKASGPDDPSIRNTDFYDAVARAVFGPRFTFKDSGQICDALRSIDAALALCERLAPHGRFMIERDHTGWSWAMVQISVNALRTQREASTPALALWGAMLSALLRSQQKDKP